MTRKPEAEDPSAAKSAMYLPQIPAYRGFDANTLLAGQQRTAEAWVAAGQRLIDGMRELFKLQLLLQSTLVERSFASAANFAQIASADCKTDAVTRAVQDAMEGTIETLRNTIDVSCKCSMDAMAVFQDRMAGGPGSGFGECKREGAVPTTAEVIAARERSGKALGSVSGEAAST